MSFNFFFEVLMNFWMIFDVLKMISISLQCLLHITLFLLRTSSMESISVDHMPDNFESRNTLPRTSPQDGQCSYTFILPQIEEKQNGCWSPVNDVDAEVDNGVQSDVLLVKQNLFYKRLQQLEVVMENYTQWLQQVESYVKDSVKAKMERMQHDTPPTHLSHMLQLGSSLLSQTVSHTRRVNEIETQVMNQTSRLEIQLLESSLSTIKLETELIRQTSEIHELHNTTKALEQWMQDMEAQHRAEVGSVTAERSRLQMLLTSQNFMIESLELSLELAQSNHSTMYSQQKQLQDTVSNLLKLCSEDKVSTNDLKQEHEERTFCDCAELYKAGYNRSGIYTIHITLQHIKKVYCSMDTAGGGWTVIQLRKDGTQDFHRTWEEYKMGFGSLTGDHWLGNEFIFLLTNLRQHTLRVELTDWDEQQVFSQYGTFQLASEKQNYRLSLKNHSGTAGKQSSLVTNGADFSTKDMDNDNCICRCALMLTGGWWFDACGPSNLNGMYYSSGENTGKFNGIKWHYFKGSSYSLRATTMMIRPLDF